MCNLHESNNLTHIFVQLVDRCPLFNVGAEKLDTTSCLQTRCPPYSYRSNDVDVGM